MSNTGLDLMLGTYLGDRFIQFCRNIHIICLKISQSPRVSLRGKMYDTDRLTNSLVFVIFASPLLICSFQVFFFTLKFTTRLKHISSHPECSSQISSSASVPIKTFTFDSNPKTFFPRHRDLNLCALPRIQDLNTC